MKSINAVIRSQGVIWRPCQECGRDWPFPSGPDQYAEREFICQVCTDALYAKIQRGIDA